MILKTHIEDNRYVTYTKQPNGVVQRFESKYTVDVINRVVDMYNEKNDKGGNRYTVPDIKKLLDFSTNGQVTGIIGLARHLGLSLTRITNKNKNKK